MPMRYYFAGYFGMELVTRGAVVAPESVDLCCTPTVFYLPFAAVPGLQRAATDRTNGVVMVGYYIIVFLSVAW